MANNLEKRITAKMVLDSTGFNSSLQGVNQQLKVSQSELKNASTQLGLFGKDTERLKGIQESLAKQIELHGKKVDVYRQSIENTTNKMNENIKERERLKVSLESANTAYNEAVKLYGKESEEAKKAKVEVNSLNEEYKKKEKAVESNAKQIQNYETNLNKANTELNKTKIELNKVNSELVNINNKWISASETLKTSSERIKKVGENVSGVGDKILKLSAPLVGVGAISLKFANDFENSMAKVSTLADETEVPLEKLRKEILKLSNDTGIASSEIANNVYDAISAGQKTGDAINFVANSTKLAKAGFADAGASLDILTTILNAYKMEATEVGYVSDILIKTQDKGKVTVGELSSVMGKVIPTAVATNTSLQQLGAGYAILTANGIKAAEATTYTNSMLNELSKTGSKTDVALREVTKKGFAELMKEGKSLSDVLNVLNDYAGKSGLTLKDMFGSAEAGKAALVLSTNAGKDFNEMLQDMNDSIGSTDRGFEKVTNTTGERFTRSLNKLKNEAIRLGDTVSPIMDKGSELLNKITERLGQLDEQQLKNITSIGLFTVGLGGFLKIGGGTISSIGNITEGFSKMAGMMGKITTTATVAEGATTGVGLATKALGVASKAGALALNPWVLGIGAVTLAGVGLHKVLSKEVTPEVDLFADKVETTAKTVTKSAGEITNAYEQTTTKISEETQKAVGAYMELDEKATQSFTNLYTSTSVITKENADVLIKTYDNMTKEINAGLDRSYNDRLSSLSSFFTNSTALSEKEEKDILARQNNHNEEMKASNEEYHRKIKEILERAIAEKRTLRQDEVKEVQMYQDNMRENAVNALSKEEVETKIIMERLKLYKGRITAEQASEVIANAEKQRLEAVSKAEQQYNETIAQIIRMRDETGTITAEQADKLIQEAERQKEQSILKADLMKQGVVNKIKEMNGDIIKDIDLTDGSIKDRWDKLREWFNNNPIIRMIKTVGGMGELAGANNTIGENWTGTNNWRGGLTYLNERGYELYDLPKQTRIYNHEASEELVLKTAESVATKVAEGMLSRFNGNKDINVTQNIYSPTPSPSELARQSKNALKELSLDW